MDFVPSRKVRLESAVSVFLSAVLLLIALAVFIKQFDFDMGRFGMDAAASGPLPQILKTGAVQKPPFDFPLPAGFKKLSEIETYTAENLFEKIDGKASLYIESGFVKLFTQRFVSETEDAMWFELFLFDMAHIKNAFSVYSVQKRPDTGPFSAMEFAYTAGNALYFVHGRYYIELVGSLESAGLHGAMAELAGKLAARVNVGEVEKIPELALFPQENLVAGSAKLYLSNALGFDGFSDTFVCQYKVGDESITAFISKCSDSKDSQAAAIKYGNFLIENGGKHKPATDQTLQGNEFVRLPMLDKNVKSLSIIGFYGTTEIISSIGPYVAGIHEAKNQKSAEKLAVQLIGKISDSARTTKND